LSFGTGAYISIDMGEDSKSMIVYPLTYDFGAFIPVFYMQLMSYTAKHFPHLMKIGGRLKMLKFPRGKCLSSGQNLQEGRFSDSCQ